MTRRSLFWTLLGCIGGGLIQLFVARGAMAFDVIQNPQTIAQVLPSGATEITNMSASVVLGGLAVYLVTRSIPAMHKDHLQSYGEMQKSYRDELRAEREAHKAEIERIMREKD